MIDEKKKYKEPELKIVAFSGEDIITLSLGDTIGDGGDNEEDF